MHHATAKRDDEACQQWLQQVLNTYTTNQLVVLDESREDGRMLIRKYGWAYQEGEASTRTSLQQGYSIFPALISILNKTFGRMPASYIAVTPAPEKPKDSFRTGYL